MKKINRILKIIEAKQNGLCVSCNGRIAHFHAIVSELTNDELNELASK